MVYRTLSVIALGSLIILGSACSGGGASGSNFGNCSSGSGGTFCLTSCSLGCAAGGCSITDIAANQPITLTFSQEVNPGTVDFSTISFKTVAGRTPEGRFIVASNVVRFEPQLNIVGGTTKFGFVSNETYVLTLPDASESGQVLRSVSGDPLSKSLSCTLRVSRGIVDLDGAPPRAKLISPQTQTNVKKDAIIVLEFSEIIDTAPFQGATTQTTPIQYLIRKTMQKPGGQVGERVCDPNFNPLILEGQPQAENIASLGITRVTLRPTALLPSQICVEVVVSNQVHDLAGTAAIPHSFAFTTEILIAGEGEVREVFTGDGQLDKKVSSGIWGAGRALPPVIGGVGELGSFDITAGQSNPADPNQYTWNTDNMTIPGKFTPTKKPITITDGVFEFSDFHLPAVFTLEFVGSNPAQIRVRGECRIEGKITANAPNVGFYNAVAVPGRPAQFGQRSSLGSCGGGAGGAGGDSCQNTGPNKIYNGNPGQNVQLPNGNSYSQEAAGTGGEGSPHFPSTGKNTTYCALNNVFAGHTGAGGGGGGFFAKGKDGAVTKNPCADPALSGSAPDSGGKAFDLGDLARQGSGPDASLDFYTVGGSGGGGGGSHPLLSRIPPDDKWVPGTSGAGGGGVIAFRVGQDLFTAAGSLIQVNGGEGYFINGINNQPGELGDNLFNTPTPGGGGSGGSVLLQVWGKSQLLGTIDTSGGKGGILDNAQAGQPSLTAKATAGDGSPGYYRLETVAGPTLIEIGNGIPKATAKNGGPMTDREFRGVSQSKFYSTKLTFPPNFLRYVVVAEVNGARTVYSDDTDVGNPQSKLFDKDYKGPASITEPVYFRVQGAKVSTVTGKPDLVTLGPWREKVFSKSSPSLNDDGATGFRFNLTWDTNGGKTSVAVTRVSVFYVE